MAWPSPLHQLFPQKIETTAGAKVKIRGGHFQLRRLPWGRPQQGSRRQRTWAEDLRWLLNRLLRRWALIRKILCGGKIWLLILLKACEKQWEQQTALHKCYFLLSHFSDACRCNTSRRICAGTENIFSRVQQTYFWMFYRCIFARFSYSWYALFNSRISRAMQKWE